MHTKTMGLAISKHEAFWEACGFGHTDKVRKFIEDGMDVDWKSYQHSYSCIHVASQGKPDIVRMLIDANCNVNVLDDSNNLAMHHAAMRGHADIMQMLFDAGSQIDVQNMNGWTPLINAAYWCQPAAIEVLIKLNCDVHLKNKDERVAIHEACRSQSEAEDDLARVTQLLVEAGCDVNCKASDAGEADFTPLIFAAYHGHPAVAKVLIKANCDLDTQTSNQWTALHWAADRGHTGVVAALLTAGANTQITGRRGELAMDRAKNAVIRKMLHATTTRAPKPQSTLPVVMTPIRSSSKSGSSGLGDGTLRKNLNNSTMTSSEFVKFLLGPAAKTNGPTRVRGLRTMDKSSDANGASVVSSGGGMCLDDIPCIDADSDDDDETEDMVTNDEHALEIFTETENNDLPKTNALSTVEEVANEMDCMNGNADSSEMPNNEMDVEITAATTQMSVMSVASDKTSSEVGFELHATHSETDLKGICDAAAASATSASDMSGQLSDSDSGTEEVVNQWRTDVDLGEYQNEAAASSNGDTGFALHATNSQTNLVDNSGDDQTVGDADKKMSDIGASGVVSETGVETQQPTERQRGEAACAGCNSANQ